MKNILKRLLPLIVLFLIIGCNDDDNKPASLIGSWNYTGYHDHVADVFFPADMCLETIVTFRADGKGTASSIDQCYPSINMLSEFRWQNEEGNNYILTSDDMTRSVTIDFEGNNKLIISSEDDGISTVYQRK